MPPEAFWTAAELCRLVEKLGKHYALLFVALSYRWLTKDHPDPEGFHLAIIANVAEKYMEQEKENWILGDFLKDAFTEAGIQTRLTLQSFGTFPAFTKSRARQSKICCSCLVCVPQTSGMAMRALYAGCKLRCPKASRSG